MAYILMIERMLWYVHSKAVNDYTTTLDPDIRLHDLGDSQEQMHREKKLQHMKGSSYAGIELWGSFHKNVGLVAQHFY